MPVFLQHLRQEVHLNNYSVVFKMKKKKKKGRKGRRRDRKRVKVILKELHKISWRFLDIQQIIDQKIPISMYIGDLQKIREGKFYLQSRNLLSILSSHG